MSYVLISNERKKKKDTVMITNGQTQLQQEHCLPFGQACTKTKKENVMVYFEPKTDFKAHTHAAGQQRLDSNSKLACLPVCVC